MQEQQHIQEEQELFSSFDFEKFKVILRKSWIFCVFILAVTVTGSYIYVRYTKPTYESSSVIKLNFDSEASILDISSPIKQEGEISGEIELLKSRLFFSKVVEALDMDVSYYRYGRVLDGERFGTSPFVVSYKIKNKGFFNRPINIDLLDQDTYRLSFNDYSEVHRFTEELTLPEMNLRVDKTKNFGSQTQGAYYFVVNTNDALVDYLKNRCKCGS